MKIAIAILSTFAALAFSGCVASLEYNNPETGVTARVSQTVDAKTIKRIRDLRNQ